MPSFTISQAVLWAICLEVVQGLHSNLTVNTTLQCTVMKTTLTSVRSVILHFYLHNQLRAEL